MKLANKILNVIEEGKPDLDKATKEVWDALFTGGIGKANDVDNFLDAVLKDHGLGKSDKKKIIKKVKAMGYKGNLLK